jgi:hypothetical protein
MLYLPYELSDSCLHFCLKRKVAIQKKIISIPHPFLFSFCPSFSISLSSILYPSLPSSFSILLPIPFSPSLLFRYIHSTCAQSFLSPHSTLCTFFPPFRPIPVFYLLVPTTKSRHDLSFFCTLLGYSGISSVIHLSYFLLYLDSLILSLLSCLFVSLNLSLTSTFLHLLLLSILPLLHWHTRFSGNISLSPSSPCCILYSFLPSILSSNFAAVFPTFIFTLFFLHSSLTM